MPTASGTKAVLATCFSFVAEFAFLVLLAEAVGRASNRFSLAGKSALATRVLLWTFIVFGSDFISRLPSTLGRRLQILRPTTPHDQKWYETIRKPSWTPPNFVFPLVWISLRILQVTALCKVWEQVARSGTAPAILAYLAYSALGDVWNKQFFGRHRIFGGLIIILLFYVTTWVSTVLFYLQVASHKLL
eukprot:jgi/Mesvir1/209/Mv13553-RA.1